MEQVELNKELIVAIHNNDLDRVKECVENGANVNTFEIGGKTYNPLYACMIAKNSSIFEYLVDNGADVRERLGTRKQSLLFCACTMKDIPWNIIVTILLKGGLEDVHYTPEGGSSPMEYAIEIDSIPLKSLFNRLLAKSNSNKR